MKLHSNLFLRKKNKNKNRLEKNLKLNNRRKERLVFHLKNVLFKNIHQIIIQHLIHLYMVRILINLSYQFLNIVLTLVMTKYLKMIMNFQWWHFIMKKMKLFLERTRTLMKLTKLKVTPMVMVKFGENFKQKINQNIGLYGHIVHLKVGVKE